MSGLFSLSFVHAEAIWPVALLLTALVMEGFGRILCWFALKYVAKHFFQSACLSHWECSNR